jgi:hypothetical protein
VQVLIVPVSGALTAAMALWLSAPPRHRRVSRGLAFAATAGVVVLFAATFASARSGHGSRRASPVHRNGSLMLVPGVDTSTGNGALFRFDPHAIGYSCAQTFYFSYVGPGPGGPQGAARCPIRRGAPYRKTDTTRPLHQLTEALRAQLRHIPRPVLIVTHSQGAWIAWSEITTSRERSVQTLLMLAPFNEGLAPYPAPGTDDAGVVGGDAVRLVTDLGRSLGISRFDPDAPLARELQGSPGAVRKLVARALPRHVRAAAVLARADLPLEPRPWPHHLTEACPGWLTHAALPTSSHVTSTINGFLDGRDPPACATWIAALGHSADAFGAPPPDP